MFNRVCSVVVMIAMLLCMGVVANAEGEATFVLTPDDNEVVAGDSFTVAVSLANNPGVTGIVYDIEFDDAKLTLNSAALGKDVTGFAEGPNKVGDVYKVSFANTTAIEGTTTLLVLSFTVNEDTELGDYQIKVSSADVSDDDTASVATAAGTTTITVIDYLWGDVNDDGVADGLDAVLIMQYAAGTIDYEDLAQPKAAYTNDDETIDGLDAVLIMQYAAGIYQPE